MAKKQRRKFSIPPQNFPKFERDDEKIFFPVPMSVFYRGQRPPRVRAFEQLTDQQAARRRRAAERGQQ